MQVDATAGGSESELVSPNTEAASAAQEKNPGLGIGSGT